MKCIYNRKGFTLIEIILALAILGIILVAFISMFTSSFVWITDAGDKGKAYSSSQEDIENRIATGESEDTQDLVITFGDKDYTIPGGIISSNETIRRRNSQIQMFVPFVPTIKLNPMIQFEGAGPTTVTILGKDTNFDGVSTKVELYDVTGSNLIATPDIAVSSENEATFLIPLNLTNNDYLVRVSTNLNEGTEVVRAKLTVLQPRYIIAGGSSIYISQNGLEWIDRHTLPGIPSITGLNSITSNGSNYVGVGDNGLVLVSQEMKDWEKNTISIANLTDVTWVSNLNMKQLYMAVGNNGSIYSSSDGLVWTLETVISGINMIDSTTFQTGNSKIVVAGEGTMYTYDGITWTEIVVNNYTNLKAIASGYSGLNFTVVGVGGKDIMASLDGETWIYNETTPPDNLNDIAYSQSVGIFVAVGENGLIMSSTNGESWEVETSGVIDRLNGVFTFGGDFIAVGDGGTILFSKDGKTWVDRSIADISLNFNAVSGK